MNILFIGVKNANTALVNVLLKHYQPKDAYVIYSKDSIIKIEYELKGYFKTLSILSGDYEGYNECTPLDASIINEMKPFEPQIMKVLERIPRYIFNTKNGSPTRRFLIKDEMSYEARKRLYYRHLRYWGDFLTSRKINSVVIFDVPHAGYDNVIHSLCVKLGLARVVQRHFRMLGYYFFADIKNQLPAFMECYSKNEKKYEGMHHDEIPLLQDIEDDYLVQLGGDDGRTPHWQKKIPAHKPLSKYKRFNANLKKGPLFPARAVCFIADLYFSSIVRKVKFRKLACIYDKLSVMVDYNVKYIYFPLHMQPEATSNPLGDVFSDQLLAIEMLTDCLPHNGMVYVKEHPDQKSYGRTQKLYEDIALIPNAVLVPRDTDTYKLVEHCTAVASLTGTAGFEALMIGKPFLMFGFHPYMYAKGTFHISTNEECRSAVDYVFKHGARHTLRDMRLFYKTISDILAPPIGVNNNNHDDYSKEEYEEYVEKFSAVLDAQLYLEG